MAKTATRKAPAQAHVYLRMPAALKKKIQADVTRRNKEEGTTLNLTSHVVGLLADFYEVKYEPPNRRATPYGGGRKR